MTHIAFDDRAIEAAFESVLGADVAKLTRSKTTKTYCDKRVAYDAAQTHDKADCAACLSAYHDEQSAYADIIANWPAHLPKP